MLCALYSVSLSRPKSSRSDRYKRLSFVDWQGGHGWVEYSSERPSRAFQPTCKWQIAMSFRYRCCAVKPWSASRENILSLSTIVNYEFRATYPKWTTSNISWYLIDIRDPAASWGSSLINGNRTTTFASLHVPRHRFSRITDSLWCRNMLHEHFCGPTRVWFSSCVKYLRSLISIVDIWLP